MIPNFTSDGVLPPSSGNQPYACTRHEVEQRFVLSADPRPWRRALFDGWDLLRSSVAHLAPGTRWWLWGSLITHLPEPLFGHLATVRAAAFVDPMQLPIEPESISLLLASIHSAETLHLVDATLVVTYEPPHPLAAFAQETTDTWRRQAALNIVDLHSKEAIPAGFIEVSP